MVFPHNGKYIAECIDLDVAVSRQTPEEAQAELRDAMKGYLETVLAGDPAGLLPRKSPFSHRLRFRLMSLQAALFSRKNSWQWDVSSRQLESHHPCR
jgi:predicted RNase H-like HicB family nuclease